MTPTRDDYNYRRATKSARNITRILADAAAPEPPDDDTREMLRKPWADGEREAVLLRTAQAERVLMMHSDARNYPVDADPIAVLRNNLGIKYLEHDLAKAIRNFRAAVDIDPNFALAHNNLGLTAIETGNIPQAIELLHRAIALDRYLDIAYGNLGLAYLEHGEFESAYRNFAAAIALDPDEPLHFNNQGVLYLELAEPGIALEYFGRAIGLDPENPLYYANRGLAWQELGKFQNADADFQAAALKEDQIYADALEGAA